VHSVTQQWHRIFRAQLFRRRSLYQLWADAFGKAKGSKIAYQASGSSSGIRQIKAKTDFGASDVALPASELKRHALLQFPSAISGVAVVYHLPGIKSQELRLTGDLLAQIFSGKITQWNDARLQTANPQLRLPAKAIEVLVREDGSGTTWNFSYRAKSAPAGKPKQSRFRIALATAFPRHQRQQRCCRNAQKRRSVSAISITTILLQEKLDAALLQNQDGKFVSPGGESFAAALNNSR
jgi:phosphate transport system substrate-binding protein